MLLGIIEVSPMLDELSPEGAHRGILLNRVALRNDNGDRQVEMACCQR
jgi:hypothetical protein